MCVVVCVCVCVCFCLYERKTYVWPNTLLAVDMKDLQLSRTLPRCWSATVERDCLCGQVDLRVPLVCSSQLGLSGSQGESLASGNKGVEVAVSGC